MIFLWAIIGVIYLSLLFLSGRECVCYLKATAGMTIKKDYSCFLFLGLTSLALMILFLDDAGDYASFMTRFANVASILISALTVALGIFAMIKHKEKENENAN